MLKSYVKFGLCLSFFLVGSFCSAFAGTVIANTDQQKVEQLYHYDIPAEVTAQEVTAMMVTYPPGGFTAPHWHGKNFVVGYVLEGEILSQLDNGKEVVFKEGQSWSEQPGTHHRLSKNNSKTKPARILAIFIGQKHDSHILEFEKSKK